jgi:uncharacterized protein (DUF58 family)
LLDPAALARLSGLELRARTIVEGHLSGLHRSPRQGFSVEFAEHREYTPGDDLRYLDWKVYGKRDRYYLKQFEEETNFACHLLVDASESMAYRSHAAPLSKWEYASCLAASLAWIILKQQDAVGLVTFDERSRETLRPSGQASHLKQLIGALERTEPSGKSGVATALHELAERIPRRGLVLLVSDLFDDPEEVQSGLRHLGFRGHDVGVLHVIDPQEQDFSFEEPTEFMGLEASGSEAVEPKNLRGAYRAEFDGFLKQTSAACRDLQVSYQLVRTDVAPADALFRFLTGRAKSRGR